MFTEKEVIDSFMTSISYKAQVGVKKLDTFFNKKKKKKESEQEEEKV